MILTLAKPLTFDSSSRKLAHYYVTIPRARTPIQKIVEEKTGTDLDHVFRLEMLEGGLMLG